MKKLLSFSCSILTLLSLFETVGQCDFKLKRSRDAAWSPDGNQIVFSSNESGIQEIYLMNADGSDRKQLTTSNFPNYYPFFSPDGKRIVYMSYRDPVTVILVMDADGSGITQLTMDGEENADPHWSPDGNSIIFYSGRDGNNEIYTMKADGFNLQRLTNNDYSDQTPSYSPNGEKIVFVSDRDGNAELYVMYADGSNQQRLTFDPRTDRVPAWHPDGDKVVYYSREPSSVAGSGSLSWSGAEIYEISLSGERKQITVNNHLDQGPVYSPDGLRVLYTSCQTGNREVFMKDLTTGEEKRLTTTKNLD